MSNAKERQFCAVCAWRETCSKKFSVPDGGAHCPDYTRDISIKTANEGDAVDDQGNREK